jgi:hypothetical protein
MIISNITIVIHDDFLTCKIKLNHHKKNIANAKLKYSQNIHGCSENCKKNHNAHE